MVLAFILVVAVGQNSYGQEQDMVFRSAYKCWTYARIFQYGLRSPKDSLRYGSPVKAHCVPKWVPEDSEFQD